MNIVGNILRPSSPLYIQRPYISDKLIELLLNEDKTKRIAVYGHFGIGKTALIETVIDLPLIHTKYDKIYCVSRELADEEFVRRLAHFLDFNPNFGWESEPKDALFVESLRLLIQNSNKKILIVLDGIKDIKHFLEWKMDIILATRDINLINANHFDIINIPKMTEEESLTLLHLASKGYINIKDTKNPQRTSLLSLCDGIPLLLTILGVAAKFRHQSWNVYNLINKMDFYDRKCEKYSYGSHGSTIKDLLIQNKHVNAKIVTHYLNLTSK